MLPPDSFNAGKRNWSHGRDRRSTCSPDLRHAPLSVFSSEQLAISGSRGRALIEYEYPYRDGAEHADMGRKRGDWDLDLFIESIPYDETRKYTQSVLGRWWAYRWIYSREAGIPFLPLRMPKATG